MAMSERRPIPTVDLVLDGLLVLLGLVPMLVLFWMQRRLLKLALRQLSANGVMLTAPTQALAEFPVLLIASGVVLALLIVAVLVRFYGSPVAGRVGLVGATGLAWVLVALGLTAICLSRYSLANGRSPLTVENAGACMNWVGDLVRGEP